MNGSRFTENWNPLTTGPPKEGMKMKQKLCLRGANFKVNWELTESQDCELAVWEGRGPARSYARTEYHLTRKRRRRHRLPLRQRVQGTRRADRQGGQQGTRGRPAQARGRKVACTVEELLEK